MDYLYYHGGITSDFLLCEDTIAHVLSVPLKIVTFWNYVSNVGFFSRSRTLIKHFSLCGIKLYNKALPFHGSLIVLVGRLAFSG